MHITLLTAAAGTVDVAVTSAAAILQFALYANTRKSESGCQ
jgi:hypothetical protein